MPKPDITAGAPCWIDLMTSDPARAQDFYAQIFGWTYEVGDQEKYGGYTTAFKGGLQVAGMMKNDGQSGYPDVWTTYLRVEDIKATVEDVTAAGGQVFMSPMEVPEQGSMSMIADASGAAIGLWQVGGHVGFQAHGEPGTAVWHELQTRDYPVAVAFYRKVFGWDTSVLSDTPEFRYSTLGAGDDATAGILDAAGYLPDGVPGNWQVYFGVENADDVITKALSLGAQLLQPAENSDFGRVAMLSDPTGATFRISQANG
ncbi:VOC family protein [Arthrobacter sp. H14-L1]|uniref:VOC family protein n=1 Tax=Arthrobacter sp. H14-L1 TaxID=2996697 RepID=UPI002270E0CF|nr:VOC family protein [Arthrobacter sp. H14-L1]MCY0904554.1 VOC family protein [Arthrobacter sp. H14-L1]